MQVPKNDEPKQQQHQQQQELGQQQTPPNEHLEPNEEKHQQLEQQQLDEPQQQQEQQQQEQPLSVQDDSSISSIHHRNDDTPSDDGPGKPMESLLRIDGDGTNVKSEDQNIHYHQEKRDTPNDDESCHDDVEATAATEPSIPIQTKEVGLTRYVMVITIVALSLYNIHLYLSQ
jgi:hypothetical protein